MSLASRKQNSADYRKAGADSNKNFRRMEWMVEYRHHGLIEDAGLRHMPGNDAIRKVNLAGTVAFLRDLKIYTVRRRRQTSDTVVILSACCSTMTKKKKREDLDSEADVRSM